MSDKKEEKKPTETNDEVVEISEKDLKNVTGGVVTKKPAPVIYQSVRNY